MTPEQTTNVVPTVSPTFAKAKAALTAPPKKSFHWSMRLMSIVSLFALAIYTYVFRLCHKYSKAEPDQTQEQLRWRLASSAFILDLVISAYFGAITPVLLKQGGLSLDRRDMPRPLFWFFAITGFVPTVSMTLTVVGGQRWQQKIRQKKAWRIFHGITGFLAYFSWWIACSPVLLISVLGEEKVIEWARKQGLLQ